MVTMPTVQRFVPRSFCCAAGFARGCSPDPKGTAVHTGWALAQFARHITQPVAEGEYNSPEKTNNEYQRAVV